MPKWYKQGLLYSLPEAPNRSTHTQVPTVLLMDDCIRIYYACRNNGKSFPAFFDIDHDFKFIRSHQDSILSLGRPGMFDSDGIMPSSVIKNMDEIWMYYIGWNARVEGARYQNEIGLAVSKDGVNFTRKFEGPIMGRSTTEPGLAVMPCVMYQNWYRMWYQSGVSWELVEGKYEPVYVIKYAESVDGIKWDRNPHQCIKSNFELEAFSRPTVILSGSTYHMWFCYRDSENYRGGEGSYRIGYGQSHDAINWVRADQLSGIDVGEYGEFDSEMVCYPQVVKIKNRLVLFYNGNGFGQSGIGYAFYED